MFVVRHYLTEDERDLYQEWLKKLRDPIAKLQVVRRVNRVESGNFGDHKFCREGAPWDIGMTGNGDLRNERSKP